MSTISFIQAYGLFKLGIKMAEDENIAVLFGSAQLVAQFLVHTLMIIS